MVSHFRREAGKTHTIVARRVSANTRLVVVLSLAVLATMITAWSWSSFRRKDLVTPSVGVQPPVDVVSSTSDSDHTAAAAPIALISSTRQSSSKDPIFDDIRAKIDPHADGWETEVASDGALSQLQSLATQLEQSTFDAQSLALIVAPDFSCEPLRPSSLVDAFSDANVTVRRRPEGVSDDLAFRTAVGLTDTLTDLLKVAGPLESVHAKFKIVSVDLVASTLTTQVYAEISNDHSEGGFQATATWSCEWSLAESGSSLPKLEQIRTLAYEEAVSTNPGQNLFVDCTEAAFDRNESYREHVLTTFDHWVTRVSRLEMMRYMGLHGVAVADVNGDGLEDVYMCDVGGLPNRLFVQSSDGTFTDRSAESGLDWLEYTTSALFVDLDNDGDQDAVLATRPFLLVAENDGAGRFALVYRKQVVTDAYNICAADFDSDRDLDLYICGYLPDEVGQLASPVPYYDANNGGTNSLLRNDTSFQFTDVTADMGLDQNNTRFSYAAVWEDFNNDGRADLYVANDFGRNNLYIWQNDRFVDLAKQAGVEDTASGMSVSTADFNGDGTMDIYVGNMFSSAGNRIAFQSKFVEGRSHLPIADIQRMARGNTLFANNGDGTFDDVSMSAGVNMGRWSWGSKFVDLNNDGWQDLMVTNGFITATETGDL